MTLFTLNSILVLLLLSSVSLIAAASLTPEHQTAVCSTDDPTSRTVHFDASTTTSTSTMTTPSESRSTPPGPCGPSDVLCRKLALRFPHLSEDLPRSHPLYGFPITPPCSADDLTCPDGTVCAETSIGLRCIEPLQLRDECIHPTTAVCASGLECHKNRCVHVIPKGGTCELNSETRCEIGTICGGRAGLKCLTPRNTGDECGRDPNAICAHGHTCQHYRCMDRVRVGDQCDHVGRPHALCEQNSVCALHGKERRCTPLTRPDRQQWAFVAANQAAWIFLNGRFVGDVHGWKHYAAVNITLNMGDVLSFIVQGNSVWSGFIASIGAYRPRQPAWSIRSGVQEFKASKAFRDDSLEWMQRDYDACHWQRVRYASDNGADIGDGKSKIYPYWTKARYVWARDTAHGEMIYVRFKRGGHKC